MEQKQDKQALVTRLTICVVVALLIYYGGTKLCGTLKLSLWEQYRPWLEKNKLQTIATIAAVIFGVSLAIYPLDEGKQPLEGEDLYDAAASAGFTPPEEFTPCGDGFEAV